MFEPKIGEIITINDAGQSVRYKVVRINNANNITMRKIDKEFDIGDRVKIVADKENDRHINWDSIHSGRDAFINNIGHIIKVKLISNDYIIQGELKNISHNIFFIQKENSNLIDMFRYEDIQYLHVIK